MKKIQINCGDIFDKITIIGDEMRLDKNGHLRRYWNCLCKCGNTIKRREDAIFYRKHQSCGCDTAIIQGNNAKRIRWKGVGDLSKSMFTACRRNAKVRNIEFHITIENAWEQFKKQDGMCALSGVPIKLFVGNLRSDRKGRTASIDRIDNNKGYTIDNIQWVHKTVNLMKNIANQPEFIDWCKKIAEFNQSV